MSWNRTAERGSILGMRAVVLCLRVFGVGVARTVADGIVVFYFLTNRTARAASRDFLRRVALRTGEPRYDRAWSSWLHFRAFGRSLVDRAAFWAGLDRRFTVEFQDQGAVAKLLAERQGAILLGAHLGNIDVLRALVTRKSTPVNFLLYPDNARKFNAVLKSIDPGLEVRAIAVEPGSVQFVLDMQAAVARGEFLALLGDRAELSSAKRMGTATFLGAPAAFPLGPYWIAHLLGCPVYLLFARLRGGRAYEVCLEPFAERILLDRGRRDQDLQAWLERYVQRLEAQCLATPLQWFNFYDFWRNDAASPRVSEPERP